MPEAALQPYKAVALVSSKRLIEIVFFIFNVSYLQHLLFETQWQGFF